MVGAASQWRGTAEEGGGWRRKEGGGGRRGEEEEGRAIALALMPLRMKPTDQVTLKRDSEI